MTLSSLGANLDSRKRGSPTNSATFALAQIFQDFVFANSTTDTNGLAVTVRFLEPNTPCAITVNGVLEKEAYEFDGRVLPQNDGDYQFTMPGTTDAQGTLVIEARRNLASVAQIGVFLNALKIEGEQTAQFRISSVERLANGHLLLKIQTPDPSQQHVVQKTASLANISWSDVAGVTFTQNGDTLEAEFAPDSTQAQFYRVGRGSP